IRPFNYIERKNCLNNLKGIKSISTTKEVFSIFSSLFLCFFLSFSIATTTSIYIKKRLGQNKVFNRKHVNKCVYRYRNILGFPTGGFVYFLRCTSFQSMFI